MCGISFFKRINKSGGTVLPPNTTLFSDDKSNSLRKNHFISERNHQTRKLFFYLTISVSINQNVNVGDGRSAKRDAFEVVDRFHCGHRVGKVEGKNGLRVLDQHRNNQSIHTYKIESKVSKIFCNYKQKNLPGNKAKDVKQRTFF